MTMNYVASDTFEKIARCKTLNFFLKNIYNINNMGYIINTILCDNTTIFQLLIMIVGNSRKLHR
jgi:hypothetical protein